MSGNETNHRSRLTLERRHQLIDLNKEYVNFDISFECRAVDATKNFEVIVVTQEQLNTIDLGSLTMKETKGGYISGNIIADEDKYQNYFLIVRSITDEPVEVDLEIHIKPIEPKPTGMEQQQPPPIPPIQDHFLNHQDDVMLSSSPTTTSRTHLVLMVIGLLVLGGAIGYYFYKNSKKTKSGNDLIAVEGGCDAVSVCSSSSSHSSKSSDEEGILNTLLHKTAKQS